MPLGSSNQNAQSTPAMAFTQGGYQNALNNLQQSLQLNNQTAQGQMNQAGQQLQQNQGRVQQGLINSGLGNTTVAQTMQQAPLNTYNNAIQNIQGQQAQRGMGVQSQMAGVNAGAGNAMASQYNQAIAQLMQQGQQNTQQNQFQQTHMPVTTNYI